MRKIFILALVICTLQMQAQNKTTSSTTYKTGVGLKLWDGVGINLKTFFAENNAADITAFFHNGGTRLSALYEYHGDLSSDQNFKWYAGFGASFDLLKTPKETIVGINGVLGLDYKIKTMPLDVSIDWQPGFQFTNNGQYVGKWFILAVRYTL